MRKITLACILLSAIVIGGTACKFRVKPHRGSSSANTEASGLFTNVPELKKAQEDLMNMPMYKGKDVNVFQDILFYSDGKIVIELQDPAKPGNVDHYEYASGKWSGATPVQLSGGDKEEGDMMKDNTTPMSKIHFEVVEKITKAYAEKAKAVEGANTAVDFIHFVLFVPTGDRYWGCSSIDGTREKYNLEFNLDGTVKEYKKD